jgi:hypothetical protein
MPARFLHLVMLLFISLWFGVIAPGHTRGVIKMGGASSCSPQVQGSDAIGGMSCCAMPARADRDEDDAHQDRPEDPAACCAICYLNTTMQTPQVISFTPGLVGVIDELTPPPLTGQAAEAHFSPIHGRAPPAIV